MQKGEHAMSQKLETESTDVLRRKELIIFDYSSYIQL